MENNKFYVLYRETVFMTESTGEEGDNYDDYDCEMKYYRVFENAEADFYAAVELERKKYADALSAHPETAPRIVIDKKYCFYWTCYTGPDWTEMTARNVRIVQEEFSDKMTED